MDLNYLNRIISRYLITVTWAYVENSNIIRIIFLMKCFTENIKIFIVDV